MIVERSRGLFFSVAVASQFFLNSGCFAKSGTANGDGALLTNKLEYFLVAGMVAQRVEIGVVLDPGFRLVIGVR